MYVIGEPPSRNDWESSPGLNTPDSYNTFANARPQNFGPAYDSLSNGYRAIPHAQVYNPTANDYLPNNNNGLMSFVDPKMYDESPEQSVAPRFMFQNNQEGGSVYKEQVENQGGNYRSDLNVNQDTAGPIRSLVQRLFG